MSDKIEYSRLLLKRTGQTGQVPTIPTGTTLNEMIPTDLFVGEMYCNLADDALWIRTDNGIYPISLSGITASTPDLGQVLYEGNYTNGFDIVVSPGNTIVYSGLTTGSSSNFLAIDASGNTILVTGSTSGGGGTNGTSGTSGTDGTSGTNGSSGTAGTDGSSGSSGTSGLSGTAGTNGSSGTDGSSGTNGSSGTSGTDGSSGTNGSSGTDGTSGSSGSSGSSGTNGTSGINGVSSSVFYYEAKDNSQSGDPGSGHILWNNVTMTASTQININHLTDTPITDIDIFLSLLQVGQQITIQDQNDSGNYQVWTITGSTTQITGATNYWEVPVSLVSAAGTAQFPNNHKIILATLGATGSSGTSGTNGTSGIGTNGSSGTSGAAGSSGTSGTGGGGGASTPGSHFNLNVATGFSYNLALTSTYVECGDFTPFQNRILAFPFSPGRNITIQALAMDIYRLNGNTAGRLKYLIYDNDDVNILPKNKLVESTSITPSAFAINQYNVSFTFSAGTTYWLAISFSADMSGPVGSTGVRAEGMMTLGLTNRTDGWGISYKMAPSDTIDFSAIPSTWVKCPISGFYSSTILEEGLWGGTNTMPMIRFKTA